MFVGRWQKEFSGVFFSFYSSGDEMNDLGMNTEQTLSCLVVFKLNSCFLFFFFFRLNPIVPLSLNVYYFAFAICC